MIREFWDFIRSAYLYLAVGVSLGVVISLVCAWAHQSVLYDLVCHAKLFSVTGVYYNGEETTALRSYKKLLRQPNAAPKLRHMLDEGSPEGQMYALLGLQILGDSEYNRRIASYLASPAQVNWGQGCSVGPTPVREVATLIATGRLAHFTTSW